MSEINGTTEIERPSDYSPEAEEAFKNAPWAVVSLDGTMPEQFYEFKIIESYAGKTFADDQDAEKFKWVTVLEVMKPIESEGRLLTVNYVIGTDTDPKASKTATWANSFAASNLRRLYEFFSLSGPQDLVGKTFGAFTVNNEYKGRDGQLRRSTNIVSSKYFSVGEIPPGTVTQKNPSRSYRKSSNPPSTVQATPTDMIVCNSCNQSYPRTEILAHVRQCQGTMPNVAI